MGSGSPCHEVDKVCVRLGGGGVAEPVKSSLCLGHVAANLWEQQLVGRDRSKGAAVAKHVRLFACSCKCIRQLLCCPFSVPALYCTLHVPPAFQVHDQAGLCDWSG